MSLSKIYIPSFNRWEKVRTYEYLGEGNIIVPKSQKGRYTKRYGKAVISIPDKLDGSVSRKRNAVLDIIEKEHPGMNACMVDDDMRFLMEKKYREQKHGDDAMEHIDRLLSMSDEGGFYFGGFDYSEDNLKLKDYQPFSFKKPIFQLITVRADDGIRYDERLRINEDVDFWAQKMNKHRKLMKDNRYVGVFFGKDGGKGSTIGYDVKDQQKYAQQLNQKWGGEIMKWDRKRFVFRISINGV